MKTHPLKIRKTGPKIAAGNGNGYVALCSLVGLLSGCSSTPESHVVSAPPPPAPAQVAVVQVPATATSVPVVSAPANTYVVSQTPPAVMQEPVTVRPSSSHVWIPGYWTWRTSRYEWMAGHWEVPPYANATWVAPRAEARDGSYVFYEGYWK